MQKFSLEFRAWRRKKLWQSALACRRRTYCLLCLRFFCHQETQETGILLDPKCCSSPTSCFMLPQLHPLTSRQSRSFHLGYKALLSERKSLSLFPPLFFLLVFVRARVETENFLDTKHTFLTHPHSSKRPNIVLWSFFFNYHGEKKHNHQTNGILKFIPLIICEIVVLNKKNNSEKEVTAVLFSTSLPASNSQRGGNTHREYYIFVHLAFKRFVYGFASYRKTLTCFVRVTSCRQSRFTLDTQS